MSPRLPYALLGLTLLALATTRLSRAQEAITLRVASWATEKEFELEARIAERFMALHPGVTVEHEAIPVGYPDKILASFAAGTVPDVFLLDSPYIPRFLNRDLLLDLRPAADTLGLDLDAYFPAVRRVFEKDGALYALPKDFTPLVMYYNKRLFDAAEVPYPAPGWTWQDYLATARLLTRDLDGDGVIDQYGTTFTNQLYLWIPWVWMNGGDILNPTGTSTLGFFNAPKTEEALHFLIDLSAKHGVSPPDVMVGNESSANVQGIRGLFYGGRLATMPSGRWALIQMMPYIRSGEIDIGVAPLPTPVGGAHVTALYAAGWCVPRTTKHRAWALRLAAFLGGSDAARIRAQSPIGVPGLRAVADEQVAADPFGIEQVFVEEAAFGRQSWGAEVDAFTRVEDLARDAVDEVMIGGRDLHEALTDYAEQIDAMLMDEAALSREVAVLEGNAEILRFLFFGLGLTLVFMAGTMLAAQRPDRWRLLTGYAFLAPSFAVLLVFIFVPLLFSLYLSVHQWNVISASKPFVGLDNFKALFGDRLFWRAFVNTVLYTLHVPVGMALALLIAVLLNRDIRGVNLWRAVFFLPSISSLVAVAMVWQWIYHPEFGLANYTLRLLGLSKLGWLTNPSTSLLSVMIVNVWIGVGYQMVIFLAGLKSIPAAFYEAARIDGATAWQQFRHVTLPLLRPTTFFVLVTSVIGSFQVFTLIFVMTEGGPLHSTDVVVFHIYQNAYDFLKMGYASAMAWLLFLVILTITWVQFRFLGKKVSYG